MNEEQSELKVKLAIEVEVDFVDWAEFQSRWENEYVQNLIEYGRVTKAQAILPATKRRTFIKMPTS